MVFEIEISYHHNCWLKYVGSYQKKPVEEQPNMVNQVTFREGQTILGCSSTCIF